MKPLVSVVIPNHNYAAYVGEAVESALDQTYPELEVIVVDDGSTDNSIEVLYRYSDRIKIIEQRNAGVCVARNRGISESRGDYIAFLDADDFWLPEKIEKQVARLNEVPDAGIVHVGVEDVNADGHPIAIHLDGMEGYVSDHLLFFEQPVVLGGGSGVLIPRKVLEDDGGFDESLSTSADWDLFFRISSRRPVAFVKLPLLRYRIHGSNMHSNIERMEREMLLAYGKAFSGRNREIRRAYGSLNRVLAGSYFRTGKYASFIRTAAKSIWYRPSGIRYFAEFPLRKFQ